MNKFKYVWMAAVVSLLLAPGAQAATMQDHAIDKEGRPILDARGNCVYTKWEVATGGCGHSKIASAERAVFFDFNKATIKASERTKLDSLIRKIRRAKDVVDVTVVGHADQMGSKGYNQQLSMKRAKAVRDYLRRYGHIRTRKIEMRAVGESQPVTNCAPTLSRAARIKCLADDRRVDIELNYAK